MRSSDWSLDVCSSDLTVLNEVPKGVQATGGDIRIGPQIPGRVEKRAWIAGFLPSELDVVPGRVHPCIPDVGIRIEAPGGTKPAGGPNGFKLSAQEVALPYPTSPPHAPPAAAATNTPPDP